MHGFLSEDWKYAGNAICIGFYSAVRPQEASRHGRRDRHVVRIERNCVRHEDTSAIITPLLDAATATAETLTDSHVFRYCPAPLQEKRTTRARWAFGKHTGNHNIASKMAIATEKEEVEENLQKASDCRDDQCSQSEKCFRAAGICNLPT